MVCTLLAGVNVVAFAADDEILSDTVSILKFYNDADKGGTGEHIYTKDTDEISWYRSLPNWNDEGEAWKAPIYSDEPVYRVFNPNSGEHLWITDKGYVDLLVSQGWNQEQGITFYSADELTGVPVYRLWDGTDNLRSHHYTVDQDEIAWLVSIGWTLEEVQFYGVDEEEPEDINIVSAEQTGANTIEFVVDRPLDGSEDIDLFNGTTSQDMVYEIGDDYMTVEITTTAKLGDSTYTVAVTPVDALLPATEDVECEAEKLDGIMFGPGLALVSNQNFYTVATSLTGANQWGEPFNLSSGTMKVYPGVAAVADGTKGDGKNNVAYGFTTGYDATKNQYVLAKSDTIPFKVGDMVSLTAVYDSGNGNVIQETDELPVVSVPNVASMEFGELATTSPKLMGERVTVKNFQTDSYYFPVEAYDQYGNELNKDSLNYALKTSMLFVNPTADNSAFGGFTEFDELEDGTVIMKLGHAPKQIPGTGTITVSAIGGLSESTSFTVEDNPYIASLSVVGMGDIIDGSYATFGLVAIDQYGDLFDLYKTKIDDSDPNGQELKFTDSQNSLSGQVASLKVTNGTLSYSKKSSTKQVGFIYTPKAGTKNDVLTMTTSVPSVSTMTLAIKEAGTPVSINKNLQTDTFTRLERAASEKKSGVMSATSGAQLNLTAATGLVFVDTNGKTVLPNNANLPKYTADVTKEVKTTKDQFFYGITHDDATTPASIQVSGTGMVTGIMKDTKFTVTLYKMDKDGKVYTLDNKDFKLKFTSGEYDDYTAVWKDGNTLYAGLDADHAYGADGDALMVFGTDQYGVTALLVEGVDYNVTNSDPSNLIVTPSGTVAGPSVSVQTATKTAYDPEDVKTLREGSATFTVWGKLGDSTDIEEVAEAQIDYSNLTPAPVAWAWTNSTLDQEADDSIDITAGVDTVTFTADGMNVTTTYGLYSGCRYNLAALDQYVLPMAGKITYTIDGQPATTGTLAAGTYTVKVNRPGLPEKTIYIVAR